VGISRGGAIGGCKRVADTPHRPAQAQGRKAPTEGTGSSLHLRGARPSALRMPDSQRPWRRRNDGAALTDDLDDPFDYVGSGAVAGPGGGHLARFERAETGSTRDPDLHLQQPGLSRVKRQRPSCGGAHRRGDHAGAVHVADCRSGCGRASAESEGVGDVAVVGDPYVEGLDVRGVSAEVRLRTRRLPAR